MGLVDKVYYDELCSPTAGRNSNRIRVYRKPNNEVVIHYRDMKITLLTEDEIQEWKNGFKVALDNLGDKFLNDL